ncbi:hypothetical protein FRB99_002036 [Tulasnella sp. 403]|nr:hypothetical protein FRB99_002036 [Tulasnella sp. 403]
MSSPEPTQVDTFDGTTPDIPSLSSLCVRGKRRAESPIENALAPTLTIYCPRPPISGGGKSLGRIWPVRTSLSFAFAPSRRVRLLRPSPAQRVGSPEVSSPVLTPSLPAIDSLGTIPYDIVKPILEDKRCTPDILRKLELNSPHLKERDQEIWKRFFFEKYPEKLEPYSNGEFSVNSWRKLYTQYRLEEEEKLVQASARLRESKERGTAEKKGRQLQLTDKLPPAKRARFGEAKNSLGKGP